MQWFDAEEFWPGKSCRRIIVDGGTYMTLKPKYNYRPGHNFGVYIKYYALLDESLPFMDAYEQNISLVGALFYAIDGYCCTAEEHKESHKAHQDSIGLFYDNIPKFVDKKELTASMDAITRWAYLEV